METKRKKQKENKNKKVVQPVNKQNLLVPADFINSITAVFEKLVGKDGSKVLIYKVGESLGRGYVQSLEHIFDEEDSKGEREMKIKATCNSMFMESGWGQIIFSSLDADGQSGTVEIYGTPSEKVLDSDSFDLERGVLAGIFQKIINARIYCDLAETIEGGKTVLIFTPKFPKELEKQEQVALFSREQMNERIEKATREISNQKETVVSIFESMVDGLVMVDNEERVIMVNPQAEKYFDIKEEDVVGKNLNKTAFGKHLYDIYLHEKEITEGKFIEKERLPVICSPIEDKENYIAVSAKSVVSENDKPLGYILVARDVTKEKSIEKLKNEFISISAHQLRTPLSAIKWSLNMIMEGEIGKIDDEANKYLNKAYQTNELMISLVNDLLNVSHIDEGKFIFNFEYISLKDLVRKAIIDAEVLARGKEITVELESEEGRMPRVYIDKEKIALAIHNVIENSIKYSNFKGIVNISIKSDPSEEKEYVELKISDDGIGIGKEEQKRVFSKFFRGENASRVHTHGTGLGLFIVKNVVDAHGGEIWFESKLNKGTTFFVRLPTKPKEDLDKN